jgi:methionine-rich copper-binding protein CopC
LFAGFAHSNAFNNKGISYLPAHATVLSFQPAPRSSHEDDPYSVVIEFAGRVEQAEAMAGLCRANDRLTAGTTVDPASRD